MISDMLSNLKTSDTRLPGFYSNRMTRRLALALWAVTFITVPTALLVVADANDQPAGSPYLSFVLFRAGMAFIACLHVLELVYYSILYVCVKKTADITMQAIESDSVVKNSNPESSLILVTFRRVRPALLTCPLTKRSTLLFFFFSFFFFFLFFLF